MCTLLKIVDTNNMHVTCYITIIKDIHPHLDLDLDDTHYFLLFIRAGSKDGETGLSVDPAKARETEAFLHEVIKA